MPRCSCKLHTRSVAPSPFGRPCDGTPSRSSRFLPPLSRIRSIGRAPRDRELRPSRSPLPEIPLLRCTPACSETPHSRNQSSPGHPPGRFRKWGYQAALDSALPLSRAFFSTALGPHAASFARGLLELRLTSGTQVPVQ